MQKITYEDLMIDDWVMAKYQDEELYPIQIKTLPGVLEFAEFAPIPITSDILQKMDLIKKDYWDIDVISYMFFTVCP